MQPYGISEPVHAEPVVIRDTDDPDSPEARTPTLTAKWKCVEKREIYR